MVSTTYWSAGRENNRCVQSHTLLKKPELQPTSHPITLIHVDPNPNPNHREDQGVYVRMTTIEMFIDTS